MAKEGLIARQFMLGVVQTAEGLPIHHEVFDGNQAELRPCCRRCTRCWLASRTSSGWCGGRPRALVAGQHGRAGKVKLSSGQALEFILAVPGRRYGEFTDVLQAIHAQAAAATQELITETRWHGLRLVVAHHPSEPEQTQLRRERIAALQDKAQAWAGKLDGQDAGVSARGRKLSDSGAKARLYHEVCEAHLAKIVKVD